MPGCPTCAHTLESLAERQGDPVRLCPRCGTAVIETDGRSESVVVYVPKLVDRCRAFAREGLDADHDPRAVAAWCRLGIRESINLPEDRP